MAQVCPVISLLSLLAFLAVPAHATGEGAPPEATDAVEDTPASSDPPAAAADPAAAPTDTEPPAAPTVTPTSTSAASTSAASTALIPASPPTATPAATPEATKPVDAAHPAGLGFGGVPALNYTIDNGFGFGLVTTLFMYDGETRPYRAALSFKIFMTSKLVQDHHVTLDWLRVGELPLRLWTRVGYLQSLTQNYCGLGGVVTCDPVVALDAGRDQGLIDEELDAFARRYYQRRFISPHGALLARYALVEKPARIEVMGGWRGVGFIPGTWDDEDGDGEPDLEPYPGSLYAKDHPSGEPGFESVMQLGVMVDSRDNEPAPTSGVWLEGSVRVSSGLIGSAWDWAGANLTVRNYVSLLDSRKLVFANRLVVDGVFGDAPIQSLARIGGSSDYYVYGGMDSGRGIRVQRYLGKLRVFDQAELRWRFFDTEFLRQRFGFTAVGFADVGVVGAEVTAPGQLALLPGFGGGLRISWNENFIVRFDVGFSPIEGYEPGTYLLIGHPF